MRIAAISDLAPGSHRAYAINVVKTCGGFVRLGHEVTVFCRVPERGWRLASAANAYAEPRVRFECADLPDQRDELLVNGAYLREFAGWAAERIAREGFDLVYARHCRGALACAERGIPTVLETHLDIDGDALGGISALRAVGRRERPILACVTISPVLAKKYVSLGAAADRVVVVPDAVDTELFTLPEEAGVSPYDAWPGPHVVYAGHLYAYKGVGTLLRAASLLDGMTVHFVGGTDEDVLAARRSAASLGLRNVDVRGRVAFSRVPPHLWHADVLVLPPSAKHPSASWTSPVKLGEYLASGRPIVASDVPALRALVREPAVRWFTPDDPGDLARAVRCAPGESDQEAAARMEAARALAERYSYANRARAILRAAGAGRGALAA